MENINLIRKIAWSFHLTTGLEWDDLFQEATLAYLEALPGYDPEKGRITTYMWWCVTSHLRGYIKKERKHKQFTQSIEDVDVDRPVSHTPLFESLPQDSVNIVDTVLSSPKMFRALNPDEAKRRIMYVFSRRGWSIPRISRSIQDLQGALNSI